jgi:hypothetical protein
MTTPTRPFSVRCKQWFPEIPLVWGGIHPTTEPEDSLNYADLIVRGEGEGAPAGPGDGDGGRHLPGHH